MSVSALAQLPRTATPPPPDDIPPNKACIPDPFSGDQSRMQPGADSRSRPAKRAFQAGQRGPLSYCQGSLSQELLALDAPYLPSDGSPVLVLDTSHKFASSRLHTAHVACHASMQPSKKRDPEASQAPRKGWRDRRIDIDGDPQAVSGTGTRENEGATALTSHACGSR